MNNKEFVGELSRRLGYTNRDASQLLSSLVDMMGEELQEGKTLSFQGFGVFEVKKRMERITVNPVTKQRLLVPPKLTLSYKPSSMLKEKFKNNSPDE